VKVFTYVSLAVPALLMFVPSELTIMVGPSGTTDVR